MEDQQNENIYFKSFCLRLVNLCEKQGFSSASLSYSLGHSHSYIHNILTSKSKLPINEFFEICDVLNVTPYEFFSAEENPQLINGIRNRLAELDTTHLEKLKRFFELRSNEELQNLIDILDKR